MRGYLDDNDKKNAIRLLFNHPLYKSTTIAIVEGSSDIRLFRRILDGQRIEFESVDGKKELLRIMKELSTEFPSRIFAICDADHDHLTGKSEDYKEHATFVTDQHDAEVMMIDSPAFGAFIKEFSCHNHLDQISSDLLNNAFSAAYPIGVLRWANEVENLKINFKGLNFNSFVDVAKTSVAIDIDGLTRELVRRSKSASETTDSDYLKSRLSHYTEKGACKLQVCCGHDLANIIAMVFRQRWASFDINMDAKKVECALRLSYPSDAFKRTRLWSSIHEFLRKARALCSDNETGIASTGK